MCTSLTYGAADGSFFLARTMDFGFELEGRPVVIPRNYSWQLSTGGHHTTRYGFVGTGRNLDGYFLADGMNEHGLAIAELYHPNEASYSADTVDGSVNLAPHEFVMWLLGELKTVTELRKRAVEVTIVSQEIELLGTVPPLHFLIMDKTGETVVVEVNAGSLTIKENPVGVMTNSPSFEWHLTNLNNYLGLKPTNVKNQTIGELTLRPFGQGSGTYGLPGGFTSPERFVRTAYLKHLIRPAKDSQEAVNNILKILNGVTIPKGVNIKDDGADDYTQYRALLDTKNGIYYFCPYEGNEIYAVTLTEEVVSMSGPTEYPITEPLHIHALN